MTKLKAWKMAGAVLLLWAATIAAEGQTLTTLYNFAGGNNDGCEPLYVTLAQGRDGALYGTTVYGGDRNGAAFRITPRGSYEVQGFNGIFGVVPDVGLVLGPDGLFYGTALAQGQFGAGTVFTLAPTGVSNTVHSFDFSDGANPMSPVVWGPKGNYYGVTELGGTNDLGAVYRLAPSGDFTLLHSFNGADGQNPLSGGLTLGTDGALYGVTYGGGRYGEGTLFRITPSGVFHTEVDFRSLINGAHPEGTLLLASDGNLYGTTFGSGTVFRLTPAHVFEVLQDLGDEAPAAGLVQASDGTLYGTTVAGGTLGFGTIFSITTSGAFAVVYNFDSVHGATAYGGLMQHTNGKLYGTTSGGGTGNCGTIYSLDLGLGPFVKFVAPFGKVGKVTQILGGGLTGTTSVTFNGVPASSFREVSDSFMEATVPTNATTGPVQVATPTGTLTSNVPFQVIQ